MKYLTLLFLLLTTVAFAQLQRADNYKPQKFITSGGCDYCWLQDIPVDAGEFIHIDTVHIDFKDTSVCEIADSFQYQVFLIAEEMEQIITNHVLESNMAWDESVEILYHFVVYDMQNEEAFLGYMDYYHLPEIMDFPSYDNWRETVYEMINNDFFKLYYHVR